MAKLPPVLGSDGTLTPWAVTVVTEYARAIRSGNARAKRVIRQRYASQPETEPVRDLMDEMDGAPDLVALYVGKRA